jgi:hypothetical protein
METRTPNATPTPEIEAAMVIAVTVGGGVVVVAVVLAVVTKVVFMPRCRHEKGRLIILPPEEVKAGPFIGEFVDPDWG